jgi:hypothetical protein
VEVVAAVVEAVVEAAVPVVEGAVALRSGTQAATAEVVVEVRR